MYKRLFLNLLIISFLCFSMISGCGGGSGGSSSNDSEDMMEDPMQDDNMDEMEEDEMSEDEQEEDDSGMDLPTKYVAIGASLTAGVQSSGISESFQINSFPNMIADQLGINDFEQPIINEPGIGFTSLGEFPLQSPLMFENNTIFSEDVNVLPLTLLGNFFLDRPYDNLGLPGAELIDAQSDSELVFEIVLRDMGTQLEQAISLDPDLVTVWIGINDVFGAATSGGNLEGITPVDEYQQNFEDLLSELNDNLEAIILVANIPNVTDVPFVNFFDRIFRSIPDLGITDEVPVIFDENFEPVDFGDGLFIPLLLNEDNVVHLLLNSLDNIIEEGEGIPSLQDLTDLGLSNMEANDILDEIANIGLMSTGEVIGNNNTLTQTEDLEIEETVENYNEIINNIANDSENIVVVDINNSLFELRINGIDGFSGDFVFIDTENTAFSLDGIHPNDAGYAIIANIFIEVLNSEFGFNVPFINTSQFSGQYLN